MFFLAAIFWRFVLFWKENTWGVVLGEQKLTEETRRSGGRGNVVEMGEESISNKNRASSWKKKEIISEDTNKTMSPYYM